MKGREQSKSRRVADGSKTRQATTLRAITVTGTNRLWRQQQRNQGRGCRSKTLLSKVLLVRNRFRRGAKETVCFPKVVLSSKISNPQLDTRRGLLVLSDLQGKYFRRQWCRVTSVCCDVKQEVCKIL